MIHSPIRFGGAIDPAHAGMAKALCRYEKEDLRQRGGSMDFLFIGLLVIGLIVQRSSDR